MNANIKIIKGGGVTAPRGFLTGSVYSGIKKKSKDALDLSVLYSEVACTAAAVFTRNKIKAAPVILDQENLQKTGKARAVVINSGCANACTGKQGMTNAVETASLVAKSLGIPANQVMVASTGVIGVQLPMEKIRDGIGRIALSRDSGHDLTRAIMTTDTRPKELAVKVKSRQDEFTIGGTAKGSGMIHPDMATLLCFLTTDAAVESNFLRFALKKAVDESFNLVSIDGDTSTNDTVLLLANGLSNRTIVAETGFADIFIQALKQVCVYLAKSIARDGEGATRLIEVLINGAKSKSDARLAARTIASSPLVKAAVHGSDPNWGRIIAAAGRSGAEIEEDRSEIYIGDTCVFKYGVPLPFDKKAAASALDREEVVLRMELNLGKFSSYAWGCDLSEDYVVINSEYTT
jgi:glutamate N-acetyltransferase/amino-acid N-acetyltransferase